MLPTMYIRADMKCGLGHIRRCQVLESAWLREGGTVKWQDPETPGILVVDDYYYDTQEKGMWKAFGNLVVSNSEFPEQSAESDIYINQNVGAETLTYHSPAPIMLLGPQYFHLGEHFKNIHSDEGSYTFDADSVKRGLDPIQFAEALSGASKVICTPGLTAYEALYLNKTVFLRPGGENVRLIYKGLIEGGYAYAHTPENAEKWKRGELPALKPGREVVDGHGAERVVRAIVAQLNRRDAWRRMPSMASG